jgi:hypothetical protein
MNFRLRVTPEDAEKELANEFNSPYFRRSIAQQNDQMAFIIELRIEKYLEDNGISFVKLEEDCDRIEIDKHLNFNSSPSFNKRTSVSERLDESRGSSLSSFNLESNSLFLRRKTSTNPPTLSGLRESY